MSFATHINTGDRPRVDFEQTKVVRLLLPPKPEQLRIADALDELLSGLDAGMRALKSAQAKLAYYRDLDDHLRPVTGKNVVVVDVRDVPPCFAGVAAIG